MLTFEAHESKEQSGAVDLREPGKGRVNTVLRATPATGFMGHCMGHNSDLEHADLPEDFSVETHQGEEYRLPADYSIALCPAYVRWKADTDDWEAIARKLIQNYWDERLSRLFERCRSRSTEERIEDLEEEVSDLRAQVAALTDAVDGVSATRSSTDGTYTADMFRGDG